MTDFPAPIDIEIMAKRAGLTMKQVCQVAGVPHSSFSRWKNGSDIYHGAYLRLVQAVREALPDDSQAA